MTSRTNARLKRDAVAHWVPTSRDQVAEAIAEIGRCQRERDIVRTAMNDQLSALKTQYEAQAKPHADRISELSRGVQLWCEANRDTLTAESKSKTVRLATGEIKWRMRPPSVSVRGLADVLRTLIARGLDRFVRVKEELDKEAVLAEPDAVIGVPGITISQREDFVIVPFSTELEEVQS
jgi:phage host-nuclease inhibitor protein Gam